MEIIGYHVKNITIVNSEGDVINRHPYLKVLLQHPKDTIQVLYKLDDCLDGFCNIIGISDDKKIELLKTTELALNPYKIRCIPNKFFSIKRSNHSMVYFCDLAQYQISTNDKFLQVINGETDQEYCYRIAKEAKLIGQQVYQSLINLGLEVKSLASLQRIFETAKETGQLNEWSFEDFKECLDANIKK